MNMNLDLEIYVLCQIVNHTLGNLVFLVLQHGSCALFVCLKVRNTMLSVQQHPLLPIGYMQSKHTTHIKAVSQKT